MMETFVAKTIDPGPSQQSALQCQRSCFRDNLIDFHGVVGIPDVTSSQVSIVFHITQCAGALVR